MESALLTKSSKAVRRNSGVVSTCSLGSDCHYILFMQESWLPHDANCRPKLKAWFTFEGIPDLM